VEEGFRISKLQVLKDYALARLATLSGPPAGDGGVSMPLPVRHDFAKMAAVKVLAWIGEDGYPVVIPTLSLQPANARSLVCWKGMRFPEPKQGALVASNILTFEAISYQVKGRWTSAGGTGTVQVQEVYAGGPPLPGGRLT
jgi:hypothetical protein